MGDMHANITRPGVTPPARGGMRIEHSVHTDWADISRHRRDAIRAWLTRNGVDPHRYITTVRLVGEGAVELHGHPLNDQGYVDLIDGALPTYTVTIPVAEPPPPEWWDDAPARCCDMHPTDGARCCDPDDCGPCCPACPTCPTLARGRDQEVAR